ncbi:MAG TPA: AAA family ATPase, partial [Blastocatellia bacterium]|nr:AAA family ATPase [Blastocatellia bacterium]
GEVGTGKTTMLRAMISRLDRSVLTSYIFNPGLTVPELYQHLAADFGFAPYTSKADALQKFGRLLMMRHSRGLRTVLVVDEAQGLPRELLEEIRLLLNFETYTEKQLQIVLTGQPELRTLLNSADLRQLKQRISLRCEIKPIKADEVSGYIRTRLKVAEATRLDLFTPDAVALIYRASEGIPRLINNICDNALLNGYAANARTISAEIISEVAESLDLLQPMIEADPRETLISDLPPMPIMRDMLRDEVVMNWQPEPEMPEFDDPRLSVQKPSRRRSRRRNSQRQQLPQTGEPVQLKVVPSQPDEFEENLKAG